MASMNRRLWGRQLLPAGGGVGSYRWVLKNFKRRDAISLQGPDRFDLGVIEKPAYVCKFTPDSHHGHLVGVAGENNCVQLFDTRDHLSDVTEIAHCGNSIEDFAWVTGGDKLLATSGTGNVVSLYSVQGDRLGDFKYHLPVVKCLDSKRDEPSRFVTACRGGTVCVWDTRYSGGQKPVNIIPSSNSPASRKRKRDSSTSVCTSDGLAGVTGVVFQDDNKVASVGYDGVVRLWDVRRHYSGSKRSPTPWMCYDAVRSDSNTIGFSSLLGDGSNLYAACRDNIVYKYSTSSTHTRPVAAYQGSTVGSFYIRSALSPDRKFLLSGSSCSRGFIWEVDNPDAPPLVLSASSDQGEVTATAWGPWDQVVLCTQLGGVMLWRVDRAGPSWDGAVYSCEEYSGESNLKSSDILRRYTAPLARSPLQPLQQSIIKTPSHTHPPMESSRPLTSPLDLSETPRSSSKSRTPLLSLDKNNKRRQSSSKDRERKASQSTQKSLAKYFKSL